MKKTTMGTSTAYNTPAKVKARAQMKKNVEGKAAGKAAANAKSVANKPKGSIPAAKRAAMAIKAKGRTGK
jgi:hypothetical protein